MALYYDHSGVWRRESVVSSLKARLQMARSPWVSKSKFQKVVRALIEIGYPPQVVDVSPTLVRLHVVGAVLAANSDDELERELAAFRREHD